MKKIIICLIIVVGFSLKVDAQVSSNFEMHNDFCYAVLTNTSPNTVFVKWLCVNYQYGQYKEGSAYLHSGYQLLIGPNVGWVWQEGEQFIYQVNSGHQYNISFRGVIRGSCNVRSHRCDGYVDNNGDKYCDNCWDNGYKCHAVYHLAQ